jgi:hypothetical protein
MLAKGAVLLLDVFEDLDLASVYPAREREQQKLKRHDRHVRRSYRAEPRFGRIHAGAARRKT